MVAKEDLPGGAAETRHYDKLTNQAALTLEQLKSIERTLSQLKKPLIIIVILLSLLLLQTVL